MIYNDTSKLNKLRGTHAFCGGSNYTWRNKTPDQLVQAKINSYGVTIGTLLHEYAAMSITDYFKITKNDKHSVLRYLTVEKKVPSIAVDIDRLFPTLMLYVNDCIGFRMQPEQLCYYSDNFYGWADAMVHNDVTLRISDLKTGVTPVSFMQLENYAAFYCLGNSIPPRQIKKYEFRIYQNGECLIAEPDPNSIDEICKLIIEQNKALEAVFGGDK